MCQAGTGSHRDEGENMLARIRKQLEATVKNETGCDVEIIVAKSIARGVFVCVFGMPADVDRVRALMDATGSLVWTDRETYPEDGPEVSDNFRFAA